MSSYRKKQRGLSFSLFKNIWIVDVDDVIVVVSVSSILVSKEDVNKLVLYHYITALSHSILGKKKNTSFILKRLATNYQVLSEQSSSLSIKNVNQQVLTSALCYIVV